jgi:hypothetical protein
MRKQRAVECRQSEQDRGPMALDCGKHCFGVRPGGCGTALPPTENGT